MKWDLCCESSGAGRRRYAYQRQTKERLGCEAVTYICALWPCSGRVQPAPRRRLGKGRRRLHRHSKAPLCPSRDACVHRQRTMASSSSGLSAPASEQSSRASTPGPAEKTPDDSSKLKTFVGILKKYAPIALFVLLVSLGRLTVSPGLSVSPTLPLSASLCPLS